MADEITAAILNVKLRAMLDGWKENIQSAQQQVEGFTKKIEDNKESLQKSGLQIGAVGTSIVAALGLAVKAAADEEEVFKRLENQLKINGVSWEQNKGKITEWYEQLQATTKYGDTDSVAVLQKLSIFTRDLDQAMVGSKLAMDMAASGLFDVDSAARYVGMALSGNIQMLGRYVPELKESTNESLKNMDANEKVAYALEVLQKKFGGLAEGELQSTNASLKQLGNYVGDIIEAISDVLNPIIGELSRKLTSAAKDIRDFVTEHQTLTGIIVLTTAAIGGLLSGLGGLLLTASGIPAVIDSFKNLAAVTNTFVLPAIGKLSAAMGVGTGGMGLILAGIAAAVVLVIKYWDELSAGMETAYTEVIEPVLEMMQAGFGYVWTTVKDVFSNVFNKISNTLGGVYMFFEPFISMFLDGFNSIWKVVKVVFEGAWDIISGVIEKMYNGFRWVLDKLGIELPELTEVFGEIEEVAGGAADAIISKWNKMGETFKRNLEENKNKNKATNDEIVITTAQATESIVDKQKAGIDKVTQHRTDDTKNHAKEMKKREEDWKEANESMTSGYLETLEEWKKLYGEYMTEEQLMTAISMKARGEDYVKFIDDSRKEWEGRWDTTFKKVGEDFSENIDAMAGDMSQNLASGNFDKALGDFEGGFTKTFGKILVSLQDNLLSKVKSGISDFFSGLGKDIAGLAGSLGTLGMVALGAKAVNEIVGAFTPDYEARRKDRERAQAAVRGYYTLEGVQEELSGSEWSFSRESLFQIKASLNELSKKGNLDAGEKMVLKALQDSWADMEYAAAAGYGYQVLAELMKEDPEYIKNLPGGTINFSSLAQMGRESEAYRQAMPSFHSGGIVQGMLGEERTIRAMAGEEVITRNDPRHSLNFGGLNIIIQGNYINSELDMMNLARTASEEILKQVRLQEALSF
jgi:hypothetical protein